MKITISIACLIWATAMACAQDNETSGSCGENLTWELSGTTIHISGSGAMTNFTTRYMGPPEDEVEDVSKLTERQKAKIRKKQFKAKAKAKKKGYIDDDIEHLIPWYNFNKFVTTIVVDEGVTTIGDNAFKGFKELSTLVLPQSIETIGREAFYWCVKLDSVSLPNATTISLGAFSGCYCLKSVSLGQKITTIEKSAFYQCRGLRKVNYGGSVSDWFVIDFQSENSNPLKYAGKLFIDNQLVTEINVPDTMAVVPAYVCIGMTSLKTLRLHEGVTSIGPHSFDGCRALNTIVARPPEPPLLERYAFLNTDIHYVYLPTADSKDSYQSAWGKRYTYYINKLGQKDEDADNEK